MTWHRVARSEELVEGEWKIVLVAGKRIGVVRREGACYAVLDICPHAGAPVCRGRLTGRVTCDDRHRVGYDPHAHTLRCPWHRWEFDLASGHGVAAIRQKLKTYPVRVAGADIEVQV
ncbi:MAG: Rieske (2Fe-2S) protein [Planctomycetota bacterium]|nr:Rieske (2Fe-2S) protein [Planctomycetota bacterium]